MKGGKVEYIKGMWTPYYMSIDNKTKESQEVGFRTYRGKAGKTSKTSTTMQYSDGMRKCFDSKSKNKK
jgi:hypothetical protein